MNTTELRQERAKVIADMQALNTKAETEGRDLNTEERSSYDKMMADVVAFKARYDRAEEQDSLEKELTRSAGHIVDSLAGRSISETRSATGDKTVTREYKSALDTYLRTGDQTQLRALTVSADGGYTIPTDVASNFVLALNRGSVMRKAGASVLKTSKNTVIPVSSVVTGGWEAEATTFDTADPTLSSFNASAFKYTVKSLLSNELLSDSAIDIQAFITERFMDAISQKTDDAYIAGAGSGSNQPTGLLTTATTKAVASATTFTNAELLTHFYALPAQYRADPTTAWIMNDSTLGFIAGMAIDLTHKIPFTPGTKAGEPDQLFYKPCYSSAAMPSAFTTGQKLLVVGATRYYQIVDRISQMGVKRLSELYGETDQTLFLGSWRTDGKCLLADAFRTLVLA